MTGYQDTRLRQWLSGSVPLEMSYTIMYCLLSSNQISQYSGVLTLYAHMKVTHIPLSKSSYSASFVFLRAIKYQFPKKWINICISDYHFFRDTWLNFKFVSRKSLETVTTVTLWDRSPSLPGDVLCVATTSARTAVMLIIAQRSQENTN